MPLIPSVPPANLMLFTPKPESVFVRREGSYLYVNRGCLYLDSVQGWALNCLGKSTFGSDPVQANKANR